MRKITHTFTVLGLAVAIAPAAALAQGPTGNAYDESGVLGEMVAGDERPAGAPQGAVAGEQVEGGGPAGVAGEQADGAPPAAAASAPTKLDDQAGGTLPFTGLEVGAVALIALALLGTGLLVRRAARQPS